MPPAALSIHLSVGAAYSWSVFKKPLEGALGISGTLSAVVGGVVLQRDGGDRHPGEGLADLPGLLSDRGSRGGGAGGRGGSTVPSAYIGLAWLWVAVPFAYGFFELTLKVKQLFQ